MRKQIEKLLKAAEDEHTKNQAVYHKALKAKDTADKKARAANAVASASANELAALKAAMNKLTESEPEAA